jgi:uncharacterized membrane protein YozB (DUF420 family)
MLTVFIGLTTVPVLAGRVALPTGRRADFDAFFAAARTLFALFLVVRLVALADRPAVFAECLLIRSI